MVAVTCILTFPDGQTVVGTIRGDDPDEDYPVAYEGAVHRLPISARLQPMPVGTFEWLFGFVADDTGAKLRMRRVGRFPIEP